MKSGNIFEGTVNSIKGQKVTLGLANGQEVTARMDGKVSLTVGQSMFFQVKSNDGTQIAIRPYTVEGSSMNLTLMEALKSANLVVDGRNLSMVNSMMEEQLSIGRDSLSQMARVVSNNPDIDVKTIVQMQKLELPITPQMAAQFENYQTDRQAIGQALSEFMDTLPEALADGELSAQQLGQTAADVINILTEGLPEEIEIPAIFADGMQEDGDSFAAEYGELEAGAQNAEGAEAGAIAVEGEGADSLAAQAGVEAESGNGTGVQTAGEASAPVETGNTEEIGAQGTAMDAAASGVSVQEAEAEGVFLNLSASGMQYGNAADAAYPAAGDRAGSRVIDEAFLRAELAEPLTLPAHTIGSLLDAGQRQNLSEQLEFLPEIRQNPALFFSGQMLSTASSAALLGAIKNQLQTGGMDKDSLLALVSGKEFQTLLKDAMEQQWMLKPEEITQKDRINRLYEKVEDQLTRLEDVIRATGQQNENVSNLASNIRSNVEFMDQINQAYTYVQIPLQMSGQNASGELYVYTNKKNLAEGKDELSAFLHLDMEHLGSTDVSVKLHGKNVSTNFYFDNDEAFALVQAHAPILEERLKEKGYNSTIKVVNESNRVNFVDDFLKKDQPSKGLVHRYSFDMKA
jgi:hypothetical protein